MNQKGFAKIIVTLIVLVVVAVLGIVGYLAFSPNQQLSPTPDIEITVRPTLTQEQAQTLVLQTWRGCTPDICESVAVSVQKNNGQYTVTAIYEGMQDDSINAEKKVAPAYFNNNVWTLGSATATQRCQLNRGHQYFSSAPCL